VTSHERFHYSTIEELSAALESLGLKIPLSVDTGVLGEPLALGGAIVPNRIVVQPMEGCDGTSDGKPGELTFRRYGRFAEGGAGMIWFEAAAVVPGGRGNPRQLLFTKDNIGDMKRLLDDTLQRAERRYGASRRPYTVLQLTHSGRYSRPFSEPAPLTAAENPHLKTAGSPRVLSDEELEELEDIFADAAAMAGEIGFDAVDIKSCHRYLISELLSARTRRGRYGGSFENRTRFLLNVVGKIRGRSPGVPAVAVRLNCYDALPYPYGWGVDEDDPRKCDLTEPVRLVRLLQEKGVELVNITAGNPYHNPHVNRPYDTGPYVPPEHPLAGVERMLRMSREIRTAVPGMAVVASGFTWLREFGAHAAAGGIGEGWFDLAGFGRQAFAYPDFPDALLTGGGMERKKCCITCGKCSEIMRYGGMAGCVVRDAEVYGRIYREVSRGKESLVGRHVAEHV